MNARALLSALLFVASRPLEAQESKSGVSTHASLTQFYQGVASGGIATGNEYNGSLQAHIALDFAKLTGWKYWLAKSKAEMRFGGPLPGQTGSINPVNTAAIVPGRDGEVFAITSLTVTRLIPSDLAKGNLFVVSAGRLNILDLIDEDFFAGSGITRFFNMAQIGPLTVVRQVPLVTNGVNLALVRGGVPVVTLGVIDPNDHSTDPGLENLFADGVSFLPGMSFPSKYFGRTGRHTLSGAVTTKKYMPFDALRQIVIPGPPTSPIERRAGSWSASYTVRQYLVERGARDGWGIFSQLSFADKHTSPITTFFDIGLGGNGVFPDRRSDEFGLAYAFTDLSPVLKDNIEAATQGNRRLRAEHQGEVFYNLHVTRWLELTADLQVIRPVRPIAQTAIVAGGRLRFLF